MQRSAPIRCFIFLFIGGARTACGGGIEKHYLEFEKYLLVYEMQVVLFKFQVVHSEGISAVLDAALSFIIFCCLSPCYDEMKEKSD